MPEDEQTALNRRGEDVHLLDIIEQLECLQGKVEGIKRDTPHSIQQLRLELKDDLEEHIRTEDNRLREMTAIGENNANLLRDMKETLDLLQHNTQPFIDLHSDMQGTLRIGKAMQDFVVWLAKFGAIGLGLTAAAIWVYEHLKPYIK